MTVTTYYRGQILPAAEMNTDFGRCIDRAGDTMTGMLTLARDPVGPLDAVTKRYVDNSIITNIGNIQAVLSWNTRVGNIVMTSGDVTTALGFTPASIASPAFTGNPTAPTLTYGNNTTGIATTAFVQNALAITYTNAKVMQSDVAPTSPLTGMLWFDTTAAQLYTWYTDPNSSQWVPVSNQAATSGSGATPFAVDNGPDCNGIILPMYFYPNNPYSDPVFLHLLDSIRANHNVPTIVIVNAGSPGGPGTAYDGNWGVAITRLKSAGARVLAYVDTNYGNRAESAVKADIDAWASLYGSPAPNMWTDFSTACQGIFLDEFAYSATNGVGADNTALYQRYYSYAYSKGFRYVVGNPGGDEQPLWYKLSPPAADMIIMWENNIWPTKTQLEGYSPDGHSYFTWKWNGILIHTATSLDTTNLSLARRYAKWFYVTDGVFSGGNPWGVLSAYLDPLYAALAN